MYIFSQICEYNECIKTVLDFCNYYAFLLFFCCFFDMVLQKELLCRITQNI